MRLHPDERERVLAANYAHINGTTSHYEYEYRLRHKDGSYRWILARGVALRDASGKAYRMAGSHVDITARKEMEQNLQQAEQRYRAVVESAPCGILVVDGDGRIRDGNARAALLLGLSAERLIDGSLVALCRLVAGDDDAAPSEGDISDLIRPAAGEQSRPLALTLTREDGGLSRLSLTAYPIGHPAAENQAGAVVYLQGRH